MTTTPFHGRRRGAQRGVVLFVALIVLIVMTLAGLALLRQMSVGTSIAGNIAFKENATFVADRGAEVALVYVKAVTTDLAVDNTASGYLATWTDGLDPFALPWNNSLTLDDVGLVQDIFQTGNRGFVLTQRLCRDLGSSLAPTQQCSDTPEQNPFVSHIGLSGPAPISTTTPFPFYRVTTRVLGPRNTVSYTQVLMQ